MINVNSFRFGQISRKQAGRFLEDGYNNGSFTFSNAVTMFDGGMSRRPPLSTVISLPEDYSWYRIHAFSFSDLVEDSYIIAFGCKQNGNTFENISKIYRRNAEGSFEQNTEIKTTNSSGRMFCTGSVSNNYEIPLTESIASKMNIAQHGRRIYIASHEFMTMYIEFSSVIQAVIPNFIYNQDSKNKIWYIPGNTDSEGLVIFESNGKYYKDIYCREEYTDSSGLSRKQKAGSSYVSGYDDFNDETGLNNGPNTYPSIINFISDRMWLANTKQYPNAIWCSRSLGSSQWIADYSSDSMHDFTEFQVVATGTKDLIDSSEWPQKDSDSYHTKNGLDRWFIPNSDFSDANELTREAKYWKQTSGGRLFYLSDGTQYTWTDSSGKPKMAEDGSYYYVDSNGNNISLDTYIASDSYPLSIADSEGNKMYWHASDYTWYKSDGSIYNPRDGYPVKWPYKEYDMSDPEALYEEKTEVSYITSDSCALCHLEINGGRDSEIEFIEPALGRIIIGTSSSEHLLDADFSPVSNFYQEEYSSYGCIDTKPVKLGNSFLFFQKGRILKELYKSSGYILSSDAMMYNHDIISSDIVCMESVQSPCSMVYVVLSDGTMIAHHYSRDDAISSPSVWNTDGVLYKWVSVSSSGQDDDVLVLCSDGTKSYICMFDEKSNVYKDSIGQNKYRYDTVIETVYAEINDNQIVFGKFKKAKAIHIRPYDTGHIYVGNDLRMLQKSNNSLGSYDASFQAFGKSAKNFSMFIKSYEDEPMNILALSWENE